MIFLTVGTQFPFDRLVKAIDELMERGGFDEDIVAQIGNSMYQPKRFRAVASMRKDIFDKHMHDASRIISHAGMGTITMALDASKPMLVVPRRRKFGEVVNDHQVAIAKNFEQLGHLLVAYEVEEIPEKLERLKTFVPIKREAQVETIVNRISTFLNNLNGAYSK